jgi:hypothetical protein
MPNRPNPPGGNRPDIPVRPSSGQFLRRSVLPERRDPLPTGYTGPERRRPEVRRILGLPVPLLIGIGVYIVVLTSILIWIFNL